MEKVTSIKELFSKSIEQLSLSYSHNPYFSGKLSIHTIENGGLNKLIKLNEMGFLTTESQVNKKYIDTLSRKYKNQFTHQRGFITGYIDINISNDYAIELSKHGLIAIVEFHITDECYIYINGKKREIDSDDDFVIKYHIRYNNLGNSSYHECQHICGILSDIYELDDFFENKNMKKSIKKNFVGITILESSFHVQEPLIDICLETLKKLIY